jgi:4-amino-4-deoxy-L-arabinose transferase-like glycosyltransferase
LHFAAWVAWLIPVVALAGVFVTFALIIARFFKPPISNLQSPILLIGISVLFIAPTIWSITPVLGADAGLPFAGPELLSRPPRPNTPQRDRLIDYLVANRGSARFLVATINANTAAPIILATGEPVMALGGFSGGDPILTTDELAQLVADNTVHYFWLNAQPNQQAELTRWIAANCASVLPQQQPNAPRAPEQQLYDCGRKR